MIFSLLNQCSRLHWIFALLLVSFVVQVLWMDENEENGRIMLPYAFRGIVVHGFGRGGKKLNCPTANLDKSAVNALPNDFKNGVYGGIARVDDSPFFPMVMSIGYNVQFDSTIKTIETHILKSFNKDFYESELQGVAFQYIRPMRAFSSLKELIDAIEKDKNDSIAYIKDNEQSIRSYVEKLGHNLEFN